MDRPSGREPEKELLDRSLKGIVIKHQKEAKQSSSQSAGHHSIASVYRMANAHLVSSYMAIKLWTVSVMNYSCVMLNPHEL